MADVITRLKLESGEYDSKIKRATQGLLQMEEECRKVGGTLAYLEDEQKQYVQSLGQMDTVSRNVRGKLAELTAAYTELRVQYQRLTDEEKQGDYGKALSSSLEQLKARIGETKSQLNEAGMEINNSGGLLDQLASKFTINVDAVKLFNAGLQAAKAALGVAQDAFFASEANVDEWGRTVAASQSLYEGFLTAINNGDISGYLTRIDQIVQAAREAYNELDKLGTMRTIQGPQFSKQEAENTRMRMMIMTGRYIAPAAGSGMKAAMAEGTVLTPEQIRRIEQKLENGMKSIGALTKNELAQTGKAIDAYYNKLAVQNGMSRSEFRQGTSSWDEFSRRMQGYEQYKEWDRQARTEFAKQGGRGYVDFDKSNPYAEYRKWGTFRVDKMGENSFNDLVGLIKQQQQQTNQLYSQMGQTYRTMNRAEGFTVRSIMNGGTGGGGGGTTHRTPPAAYEVIPAGSVEAATKKVQDLQKAWRLAADDDSREKINKQIEQAQLMLDVLSGKVNADTLKIDIVDDKALNRLGEIDGLHFDPKTLEIVVESREAWNQLRELEGITFAPKTLPVLSPQELVKGRIEDATRSQATGTTPAFDFSKALGDTKATITAEALAVDQESFNTLLRTTVENGISSMDGQFAMLGEKLAQGINIPDSAWEAFVADLNAKLKELGIEPITLDVKTGELSNGKSSRKEEGRQMQQVVSGLQSVAGGLQQMGIELPKSVQMLQSMISGVMTVVQGVQAIITAAEIAETTNTTALSGNTAAVLAMMDMMMVKSMSSIASFGFANGGVVKAARGFTVPGTHFSGDVTPILANAGEVVLNRAQVGNLASILEGGSQSNLHLETRVDAEDLIFVLNNNAKRRGRGTYIKQ